MDTELGRIAGMLREAEPGPTPLQKQLAQLGRTLAILCLAVVAVIFVLGILRGERFLEVFLLSVSLAVAAVPEGLPAVVTMTLALGMRRMACRNALVRKLPSVETLGCVTVICSDKTGTLTRNEMTARTLLAGARRYEISGTGYAPTGEFRDESGAIVNAAAEPDVALALTTGATCNRAQLHASSDGKAAAVGDPTEIALLVAARKAGIDRSEAIVREIPFDSDRKRMSVLTEQTLYCKGAPEVVLPLCGRVRKNGNTEELTERQRQVIFEDAAEMARRALRVPAMAYRPLSNAESTDPESNLIFAGLIGLIDPPREEVKEAVARCRSAGIRPVMITGDHPATALAIARELGIASNDQEAMTGVQLDGVSDAALAEKVTRTAVYARATAEHKLRIVRALQTNGRRSR